MFLFVSVHLGDVLPHSGSSMTSSNLVGLARGCSTAWRWRMSVSVTKEHGHALCYVNLPSNWHRLTPRTLCHPPHDGYQKLCSGAPVRARTLLLRPSEKPRTKSLVSALPAAIPTTRSAVPPAVLHPQRSFYGAGLHRRRGSGAMP